MNTSREYHLHWNPMIGWTYAQESNMQVAVNTQNDEALEHLVSRLHTVYWTHKEELRKKFHIARTYPKDKEESKKWFDEGKFYWEEDEYRGTFYIHWGDKPDLDGYEKAINKMSDHKKLAEDIIRVKTDEDARLKALHDFESATFH